MKAVQLLRKKIVLSDDSIMELVLWKLPKKTKERPHALKYRLHYGRPDGTGFVRYDNELGKGDHRHYEEHEEPYHFVSVEKLIEDFWKDVTKMRKNDE